MDTPKSGGFNTLAFIVATLETSITATDQNTKARMLTTIDDYIPQILKTPDEETKKLCRTLAAKMTKLALDDKDPEIKDKAQKSLCKMIKSEAFNIDEPKLLSDIEKCAQNTKAQYPEEDLKFLHILPVLALQDPKHGEKISHILKQAKPINTGIVERVRETFEDIQNQHLENQVKKLESVRLLKNQHGNQKVL